MTHRFSIRRALAGAVLLLTVIFGAGTAASIWALRDSNQALSEVNREIRIALSMSDSLNHLRTARVWLVQASTYTTSGMMAEADKAVTTAADKVVLSRKAFADYQALKKGTAEQALADAAAKQYEAYVTEGIEPLVKALKANDAMAYLRTLKTRTQELDRTFEDTLTQAIEYREKQALAKNESTQRAFQTSLVLLLGLAGVFAVAAFAIWRVATASVVRPLHSAAGHLRLVAGGDLSHAAPDHVGGEPEEVAQMIDGLAAMQRHLRDTVSSIRESADQVGTATMEIAQGNQDLSTRTEEQAANLQRTASSMDQMAATVGQTAQTAQQATHLAASASQVASKGEAMVGEVISTMSNIHASSARIGEITSVIDGISFQTNILALNAAVEAARAGEHGRGFAVVAAEVRTLAQRSASAAKEIKTLIADSAGKVEHGVRCVNDTGETMKEILSQVARVSQLIGEIHAATSEQNSGLGEVSQAVSRIDQATQQNAALVEEGAAAAESLKHQAQLLTQAVRTFQLSGR